MGWSQSYHVEVVPPGDMRVAEAVLEPVKASGEVKRDPQRDDHRFRPHMQVSDENRDSVGQVNLAFYAERDALVFPLALSAVVIASLLAVIPGRLDSVDFQTLAALLVLPFALAAYYVRDAEHSYVTSALRLLRLLAALPVVSGLLVLAMLGLGYLDLDGRGDPLDPDALRVAEWAARVTMGSAVLLVAALVSPVAGGLGRRVARSAERRTADMPDLAAKAIGSLLAILGVACCLAAFGAAFWVLYSELGL